MPLACPNPLCPRGGEAVHLAPMLPWSCPECHCLLRTVQTWAGQPAGATA